MADPKQKEILFKKNNISNKPWVKKTGIFLVVLSCVLYGGLLLVPFSPYTVGIKAAISSILIISGEVSFWLGALILGKELLTKYRKHLNPFNWFKKKSD